LHKEIIPLSASKNIQRYYRKLLMPEASNAMMMALLYVEPRRSKTKFPSTTKMSSFKEAFTFANFHSQPAVKKREILQNQGRKKERNLSEKLELNSIRSSQFH
jgi:hypothetical protein